MPVEMKELEALASDVLTHHGHVATAAASAVSVCRKLLNNPASSKVSQQPGLLPVLFLIERCVYEWAERGEASVSQVDRAIDALMVAGRTAEALDRLPDEIAPSRCPVYGPDGSPRCVCLVAVLATARAGRRSGRS